MCGRFTQTKSKDEIAETFGLPDVPAYEPKVWSPSEAPRRFNIAPTEEVLVVRARDSERAATWMRWGYLPHFAKSLRESARMINARSDTVFTKPAFRDAIVRRRCLVPADGFIEWKKEGKARRPFHIRAGGGLFAMGGIWSRWRSPGGDRVETFSILTTEPNDVVKPMHDRMPVILPPKAWDLWLSDTDDRAALEALLVPFPAEATEAIEVSRAVNDVRNEEPSVLDPAVASPPE